jgi:hypothetical protein
MCCVDVSSEVSKSVGGLSCCVFRDGALHSHRQVSCSYSFFARESHRY